MTVTLRKLYSLRTSLREKAKELKRQRMVIDHDIERVREHLSEVNILIDETRATAAATASSETEAE